MDEKEHSSRYYTAAVVLTFFGIVALLISVGVYWHFLHKNGISPDPTDWGSFGAYITGAAGTLIALVTLIALAITLHLQATELRLSRKLMSEQAATIARQTHTLERQAATLEQQATESTFFQLLAHRRETIASLRSAQETFGRLALTTMANALASQIYEARQQIGDDQERLSTYVISALRGYRSQLDPVIGSTIQLLLFALNTDANGNGLDYFNVTRADFTMVDRVLLLYVGLSTYGDEYGVFDVVHRSRLMDGLQPNSYNHVIEQRWIDKYRGA